MITRERLIKTILTIDTLLVGKNLHYLLRLLGTRSFINKISEISCRKKLRNIQQLRRIMLIPDVNLGDAVIGQVAAEVLRCYYPECDVDFICNKNVLPLLAKNPHLSNIFPFDQNGNIPSKSVRSTVKHLLERNQYDLIICLSPFFTEKDFRGVGIPVIDSSHLILNVLHSRFNGGPGNVVYNLAKFVERVTTYLPHRVEPVQRKYQFSGHKIFLADDVFEKRENYLKKNRLCDQHTIVFFNPDTSDKYTFIDSDIQVEILNNLVKRDSVDFILLGSGHTYRGIQEFLLSRVPDIYKSKIIGIPRSMPLDLYASLLDAADLFITGDTGPMHIAAAWKQSKNGCKAINNSTSLVTLFGSTDANIYGYDSYTRRFLQSPQKAPSKIFDSPCPQKNILCTLEKIGHQCRRNDCFRYFQAEHVSQWVSHYLTDRMDNNNDQTR